MSLTINARVARNEPNRPNAPTPNAYWSINAKLRFAQFAERFLQVLSLTNHYDQHQTHSTKRGTLRASISMRDEFMGLRRSDTSTAALLDAQAQVLLEC